MRRITRLNLATEPFRQDRHLLVASLLVGIALAGLLSLLISTALAAREASAETRQAIGRLEEQLRRLSAEQAKISASLRRPENAAVLDRNVLLNILLSRKAVSWTRVFSDLEGVLPHNVRLVSVRPEINARNEVMLQMVVGAQSGEPVLALLMALEGSPQFGATSLHSWLPPSQNEPLYRYRVSVRYAQRL